MAFYLILLLIFTFGIPMYIPMSSFDNPGLTSLEIGGLLAGLILNWALLIIFVKKGWNKILLLFLFLPVFKTCQRLAEGKLFQTFNSLIILFLGLSMIFLAHHYCQFLKRHFKKEVSLSLIRIIGVIIAIAVTLLGF